jgi:MATE family multidrug resistance protein
LKDYLKELKQFLKLGIPIYGSQASYAAMGLTDTIVAGRAGAVELSGVAIGSSVANPLFFSLSGLMFAITPIVAHLFGAKQLKDISLKMKEVIWIALGVGLILTLAYPLAGSLLKFSSIDKEILEVTFGYLSALSIGATAIVLFTALRCFSEGITQTRPVFWVAFIGMLVNIPLDIILVNGYFGLPKLGGVGCGLATSFVSIVMLICMTIVIQKGNPFKEIKIFNEIKFPKLSTLKELMALGIPIGIGIFVELSMFSGAAIILGPLGDVVVASHAVALSIASFFFMMPLSIGLASATRVGNLLGANNFNGAKIASFFSVGLCLIGALINVSLILLFTDVLVNLFTTEKAVFAAAVNLLIFAAIFQLPDGIQMGALGSLRGYKDTFIPMIFLGVAYWIFGLPIGYYLTYYGINEPMGAGGVWIGMIVGLTIAAVLLINRLRKIS